MLQSITEYYRVLQSVTEYCRVLVVVDAAITSYLLLLEVDAEYCRVLQSITEYYRVLQSITKNCKVIQSITKTNLAHLFGPIFGLVCTCIPLVLPATFLRARTNRDRPSPLAADQSQQVKDIKLEVKK